jgi:hypothetical protein
LIPPEQYLKTIIESTLHMYGVQDRSRWVEELIDALYKNIFRPDTIASIRIIIEDIRQDEEN